jgi:sortase A
LSRFTAQAWWHQKELQREFEARLYEPASPEKDSTAPEAKATPSISKSKPTRPKPKLKEGELVGRLEIPKLNLSVMVMEGTGSRTLRLGAGRIRGTATPWTTGNMGIAGHRDTFFKPLKGIKKNDTITFTTVDGTKKYTVTSTSIVMPTDTYVLKPSAKNMITLVTCYPFYYVGPAPKRFIVQAVTHD